jgi:hypothetical protein
MAWRYHGSYSPDPYAGRAHGSCDRCTQQWELSKLQYQYEYRGDTLTNTRFRVCPPCMDKPYEGYRPVKLPPDPVPVLDPRVEPFAIEENAGGPTPVYNQPGLYWDEGDAEWEP